MKKILLTLMALCFWMSVIPDARADFELLETVLSALENIQKKVQVVQEKYQKIESQLNALRQGPLGKLTAISSKLDFKNISVRTLPIVSENIGNLRNLEKAIQKGTMANLGKKNQIILSAANEKNNADIMREDLSRLYAYAFTLRTCMTIKMRRIRLLYLKTTVQPSKCLKKKPWKPLVVLPEFWICKARLMSSNVV